MKIKQIAKQEKSTYTIFMKLFWILEASGLDNSDYKLHAFSF
jgi:hypothetical protein